MEKALICETEPLPPETPELVAHHSKPIAPGPERAAIAGTSSSSKSIHWFPGDVVLIDEHGPRWLATMTSSTPRFHNPPALLSGRHWYRGAHSLRNIQKRADPRHDPNSSSVGNPRDYAPPRRQFLASAMSRAVAAGDLENRPVVLSRLERDIAVRHIRSTVPSLLRSPNWAPNSSHPTPPPYPRQVFILQRIARRPSSAP